MTRAVSNTTQSFRADDEAAVARLADHIVAVCQSGGLPRGKDGLIFVPSERELSVQLQVSRHAVRVAVAHLQRRGMISRSRGRGPLLLARTTPDVHAAAATDLRCINLIFDSAMGNQLLPFLRDEYLAGYTEALEQQNAKVRYVTWRPDQRDFESLLWRSAAPQQQACLAVGQRDAALLNWLKQQAVPFVVQNYCRYDYHDLPSHHKVYVNKAGAAFQATQQLLSLGHRRVAFVGPMPDPSRSTPEYEGYHAALRCAGFDSYPGDVVDYTSEVAEHLPVSCRRLLDRPDRPTAVFGAFGSITVALLEAAKTVGLRVPQDLSIIGFDGEKTPAYPQLSTIVVPRRSLALQAMELLLNAAVQSDLPPQTRVVECHVNYQDSVGPVPG